MQNKYTASSEDNLGQWMVFLEKVHQSKSF